MKILESRQEQVIVLDNAGKITTRPTTQYYKVKFFKFNDKKINHIFSNDMYVMETNDDRIFNCWCKGSRFQMRQDLANKLCEIILLDEKDNKGVEAYEGLFLYATSEIPDWQILEMYLGNISESVVRRTNEGYIIHGEFLIDFKGNAWRKRDTHEEWHYKSQKPGKPFQSMCTSLCIVLKEFYSDKVKMTSLPFPDGSIAKASPLTMTILSKVLFLVNPNMEDDVFVNQLPKSLKIKLTKLRGGELK